MSLVLKCWIKTGKAYSSGIHVFSKCVLCDFMYVIDFFVRYWKYILIVCWLITWNSIIIYVHLYFTKYLLH